MLLPPRFLLPTVRLFAISFGLVCLTGCRPVVEKPPEQIPLVRVRSVVRDEHFSQKLELVGTVVPMNVSRVAADVAGRVVEFPLREGDLVPRKQLLARLLEDTISLEIKEAEALQKKVAEAAGRADKSVERLGKLLQQGTVTQEAFDDADSEARQAKAAADAATQTLARLRDKSTKHRIHSPLDGKLVMLVERHTNVGEWVEEGGLVATLADLSQVEITVPVEETYISMVSVGQTVDVRFDALAGQRSEPADPAENREATSLHRAQIVHIVPRANWPAGSRSFPVRIRIDNWTGPKGEPVLKEGMLARVTLQSPPRNVLKVHKDCIVRASGKPVIFRVEAAESRAVALEIELGAIVGDYVEVAKTKLPSAQAGESASGQLAAGDSVVSEGGERLRSFQRVEVIAHQSGG